MGRNWTWSETPIGSTARRTDFKTQQLRYANAEMAISLTAATEVWFHIKLPECMNSHLNSIPWHGRNFNLVSYPETRHSHFYLDLGSVIQSFKCLHIISWCSRRNRYPQVCYHIHTSVSVPGEFLKMQKSFQTLHWTSTTRMTSYLNFPSTDTELFIALPSSLLAASSCCH